MNHIHASRLAALVLALLVTSGCQSDSLEIVSLESQDTLTAETTTALSFSKANPRPQTWVDGELFAGVVTPATFNPESDPFDELYAGGNGFKDGVPLISESKPGDQDYNGGRWHLNVLKADVDPNKYANATGDGDLDLNDFESTDQYFECPLLPRRGKK